MSDSAAPTSVTADQLDAVANLIERFAMARAA
jgi:hypothetical protein